MKARRIVAPALLAALLLGWVVFRVAIPGLPENRGLPPIKRTADGLPVAEMFDADEYLSYREACRDKKLDHLDQYTLVAINAKRELDAYRAVVEEDKPRAFEMFVRRLVDQAQRRSKKEPAEWERAVGVLPEFAAIGRAEPVAGCEPLIQLIDAYLLFNAERYEEAERLFATLPDAMQLLNKNNRSTVYSLRMSGYLKRDQWREAYRLLSNRRWTFDSLSRRFLNEQRYSDLQELLDLHAKYDPNDPLRFYHAAFLKFEQRKFGEVLELTDAFFDSATFEPSKKSDGDPLNLMFSFYALDMRFRKAFSLVMLDRLDEAEVMLEQIPTSHLSGENPFRVRIELILALCRHDIEKVGTILATVPWAAGLAYVDPDYRAFFLTEPFAGLRQKYPRPMMK